VFDLGQQQIAVARKLFPDWVPTLEPVSTITHELM
jgi:hypothetical protein